MHSFVVNKDNKINDINTNTAKTPQKIYDIQSSMIKIEDLAVNSAIRMKNSTAIMDISNKSSELDDVEMFLAVDTQPNEVDQKIKATKLSEVNSWVLVTPTVIVRKRDVKDVGRDKEDLIDLPLEEEPDNGTVLFKREIIKPEQQPPVQVHIQNITEVSEYSIVNFLLSFV